jgi:hypothetical protein
MVKFSVLGGLILLGSYTRRSSFSFSASTTGAVAKVVKADSLRNPITPIPSSNMPQASSSKTVSWKH